MASIKIMLDKRRPKKNQELNIVFRVTHERVPHIISTGLSTHPNDWNESLSCCMVGAKNATTINNSLSAKLYKLQEVIAELEVQNEFSIDLLRQSLVEDTKDSSKKSTTAYFNEFSKSLINSLIETNKVGNAQVYCVATKRLMSYANKENLPFKEIDYTFLEGFKALLISDKVKVNTISNYFRTIRAIFNKAIKSKLIDRALYPFEDIQIKSERTPKRAISKGDLLKLYNADVPINSKEWHAKNYFFLSFALIGTSFTDMAYLTNKNIYKGRLSYRRRKTKKFYDIKLTPMAKKILSFYKCNKYLLPIFPSNITEDSIEAKYLSRQVIKDVNDSLKKIAKEEKIDFNLTTYVARHSWATTAKRMGYSNEVIAEALGHEYGNKTTNIYLESFDKQIIDDMNQRIQEYLFS